MSITIHAESVTELRKIFTDMFGAVEVKIAEAPAPAPTQKEKPASKPKEKPVEKPAETPVEQTVGKSDEKPAETPVEQTVGKSDEKPADASRPELTKDVVLAKIKKIKASTDPDIGTKVKGWLEKNSIEKLADCTSDQFYSLQKALGIK